MVDTFGSALRALRTAAGYPSLASFARVVHCSKSYLGNIETGARRPTAGFAATCDHVLGTTPTLATIAASPLGDDVNRRALLASIAGVSAAALAAAQPSFADTVRHGLLDAAGGDDPDQLVASYAERLVTDPSPEFGAALLREILAVRHQLAARPGDRDLLRTAAGLAQHYGLWQGNLGNLAAAHDWYRTAATLAVRSGDTATSVYVQARTLSRATYEGYTISQTLAGAERVLAISARLSPGVLEAHAARVHAHALAGDLAGGRAAMRDMHAAAEALPADPRTAAGHLERAASFASYLECRAGSLADAERAYGEARATLQDVPLWAADARIYYGRALVRHGRAEQGLSEALTAVNTAGQQNRVLRIGARDVLSVLPAAHRSDAAHELRAYAANVRGPWETT